MSQIQVLHIIKTLNLGGAETNLLNFAKAMPTNRVTLHVAYSFGGELESKFADAGIKLFKFADQPQKLLSFESFFIIFRLFKYIKKAKIDVVHSHTFNTHVWGSVAAKLAGCKILEHVHDSRYMDPKEFARRGEMSKQYRFIHFFKNISDLVVVLTRQNVDFIIQNKLYPLAKVREQQNGINFNDARILNEEQKKQLRQKFNIPANAFVVLTPIRFSPEKNLKVLLEILLESIRLIPGCVCVVAGSGPEKENFEAAVRTNHAQEQIKTIGFYPDISGLLNIVDVFLLPSTIELHSIAILEAMRQKVPVVVSQGVGCNDEFIQSGKNGFLIDPFSKEGWAQTIQSLQQDPLLRQQIGQQGYLTCLSKFNINDHVKSFENFYVELKNL